MVATRPLWKANILSDKRRLPTSDIYTSRRSILTIQTIHRSFSKIAFIAFSQMSNTLIQGGVSALGEIPIWTLRQLFRDLLDVFWAIAMLEYKEGGGVGYWQIAKRRLERFARRCVLLKTTRTLPIDCVVIRAIRECSQILKKGNIYSFRLCGQIPPKALIWYVGVECILPMQRNLLVAERNSKHCELWM